MIRSMMQEERRASHVMMSPPFMLYMISAFRFESASLASGNLRVMTGLSVSVWLRELLASQCTLKTVLMEEREREEWYNGSGSRGGKAKPASRQPQSEERLNEVTLIAMSRASAAGERQLTEGSQGFHS